MSDPQNNIDPDWPSLIAQWKVSNQSKIAFCIENGISESHFYAAIKKLSRKSSSGFAKATISKSTKPVIHPPPLTCTIELPNKAILTLNNPSVDVLRALIQ